MLTVEPSALQEATTLHAVGHAKPPQTPISAPCLLRATGLRKAFGGQVVLDGVNLELRQGEVVLLRGENGSGKTTLLNILTGNLEPDVGVIHYLADGTPRAYRFPRRWWQELNPFDHFTPEFVAREGMGRTWQDIRLFGFQSLRDNIAVAETSQPGENPILALLTPRRSSRREAEIRQKADAMLARLGLAGRETSSADKISLGQSKRVAIARAVAAGARILFLDEPLAGLDRQGVADVLALLQSLVREDDVTLVIVEHVFNQSHLQGLITTDWLLKRSSLTASSAQVGIDNLQSSSSGRPAWSELSALADGGTVDEALPRGGLLTRIRRSGTLRTPTESVLQIRGLLVKRGQRIVIGLDNRGEPSGFNLTIYRDEIAILQAPNGWGKSTLFAAITGHLPIESGEICIEGRSLHGLPVWDRVKEGLRALPCDSQTFPSLRAREAIQLAGKSSLVDDLGILADRTCSSLSGGERQRVALCHTLSQDHGQILTMLDEPFSAFDGGRATAALNSIAQASSCAILLLVPSTTR